MPRASSSSDVFNAISEKRRRDIVLFLAGQERPVGEIVAALAMPQPSVSKHLLVLHQARVVEARRQGRCILYRTRPEAFRPVREWTAQLERYWSNQLSRIQERAEKMMESQSQPKQEKP